MTTEMTPAEVIREARAVLFERGWGRGDLLQRDGTVCALGAIAFAEGFAEEEIAIMPYWPLERLESVKALAAAAPAIASDVVRRIYISNDFSVESFDELMDWFDKAEKLAEAAESDG